ncbi:MAG: SgcJ/EcaC family oxidoreductase [Corynebacterium sp.]|uniref:SgcJ/EcaC family oxidoreductase n=1 Tax=Corynebacterium sp. TaxID=1720 RepID=UPI0026DCDC19|nr:SgcJ/EcaC family oxidoreductase [Corynebacterium sp.]MDO5098319.1 SgcJ/EcaC family oxidoreductase [Corynebacterium sp.]
MINERWIEIDCNQAIDAGTYTFTYADGSKVPARYTFIYGLEDGEWKITTHHSSAMPEEGADTNLPAATGTTGSPQPDLKGENCVVAEDSDITGLFDTWNAALQTGDAAKVADLYGEDSILLPTVSNKLRFTEPEKEDYFVHFLEKKPVGTIDQRWTTRGCNTATDSGLYTFKYEDGTSTAARFTYTYKWDGNQWKISSHHSSAMPEK